ncbi:MAG TPA: DUF4340 domain-containing protein [Candidatus Acidoferrum sp.]|nr:DUF4340 domain-containing protein [Candidatus Acidoferrum sp.]
MNSKTTGIWFAIAAALFAVIVVLQHFLRPPVAEFSRLLPDLHSAAVTSVQVIPSGALEIRADRTNEGWQLTRPVLYPAQAAAIEALLNALEELAPATRISAAELHHHRNADAEFGFEKPRVSLVIDAGDQRRQLLVGNLTPPGDQVFLRVVGVDGAFVADAGWLSDLPRSVNDWRDTGLVPAGHANLDWIVLTNGAKAIELRRDPTNHLWRMVRPFPARADTDRITDALQHLLAARAAQFVTDDPRADWSAFGLQPAELDLWLGRGTNLFSSLHVGKSPTNDPVRVYAQRDGWPVLVTTDREPLLPWRSPVNYFRDSHLLELTAPVGEITVSFPRGDAAPESGPGPAGYTLQRQDSNTWQIVGEKYPADAESVQLFLKALAGLRIPESGFVKDVVTEPDLPAYGLKSPMRQITLSARAGDTNSVLVQLSFGTNQNQEIFARRADEDFIYAITPEDFNRLPEAAWEFRERRLWNFAESAIAQITIHQDGKTRQVVRHGLNKWSLAPGSQGIINPPALEETAHRLGELTAVGWVAHNVTELEKYGFKPENLSLTVELKDGAKYSVDFGLPISNQTALAAVMLEGERWVFVFPPALYQFVSSYLTIPASVP